MSEEREGSAADFAALFNQPVRRNDALARILCGLPADDLEPTPSEPDPPPSFDGGARETPPLPSDPWGRATSRIPEPKPNPYRLVSTLGA